MPNYAALKTALATGGAYAGMTDAQAISACNAATVPQPLDVAMSDALADFALGGLLPTIKGWATNPPPIAGAVTAQASNAAQTFGLMVGPPPLFDSLQFSDPTKAAAINALISALVSAGLIPAAAAQTIGALAQTLVSQASLWGWPGGIIENDLVAARAA